MVGRGRTEHAVDGFNEAQECDGCGSLEYEQDIEDDLPEKKCRAS